MRKSRVEKNKDLYENLEAEKEVKKDPEIEEFDIKDITEEVKETKESSKVENKPQLKEEKVENDIDSNLTVVEKEEFKVEQPLSYNQMLKAEEVLREKLEKQKELKNSKKGVKRTPITDEYTPQMMQKNISQAEGVDIRKDLNMKVRRQNDGTVVALIVLLIAILIIAAAIAIVIFKK